MTAAPRTLILSIAVLFPIVLLAFFALRTLNLEQDALKARNLTLLENQVDASASVVNALLELAGRDEIQQVNNLWNIRGSEALRYYVLSGEAGFALVFDEDRRVFPPVESDQLLLNLYGGLRAFEEPARGLLREMKQLNRKEISRMLTLNETTLTLLRCSQSSNTLTMCAAVEPNKVTAALQKAVSQAIQDTENTFGNIWIVSPENQRFGNNTSVEEQPVISRALKGAFSGWRIEVVNKQAADIYTSQFTATFIIAAVLLVGCAVVVMNLYQASINKVKSAESRSRVIAHLSHELHTPLANLRLYADLLQRKADNPDSVKRYAGVVEGEISRLEEISKNAVELSKGALDVSRMEWGYPDEILCGLIEKYTPLMSAVNCSVSVKTGVNCYCLYDRSSWERIIINLLDNARKYAPGSEVNVSSVIKKDKLILTVADTGPGVSAHMRDSLFEPLTRDAASNVPGFGLGLSVVKALAGNNGGDVSLIESEKGAVFVATMKVREIDNSGDTKS